MSTSDKLSALALLVSVVSLWLSYRVMRSTERIAAAEKRTEARSILVSSVLEAQQLLGLVRTALSYKGTDYQFPKHLPEIEAQLALLTKNLQLHLSHVRESNSGDAEYAERLKGFALEAEARLKQVSPMIRDLPVIDKQP